MSFRFREVEPSPAPAAGAGTSEDVPSPGQEAHVRDVSVELSEDSKSAPLDSSEAEKEDDSERSRSADEPSHKNRSKRESRRMRELEQAQFSLELLKVRATGVQEDSPPRQPEDPRGGSPASRGSLELLGVEDMETDGCGGPGAPRDQDRPPAPDVRSNRGEKPAAVPPRATFYFASDQSPVHEPTAKSHRERRESTTRRPVVVLISMQKESPVEEGPPLGAQTPEGAPQAAAVPGSHVTPAEERPRGILARAESDASGAAGPEPGPCSSEVDIQIVPEPKSDVAPAVLPGRQERKAVRPQPEAPGPVLDTKPPKAQKKSSAQTVIVNMVEKPANAVFSPPRRKLPFSKYVGRLNHLKVHQTISKYTKPSESTPNTYNYKKILL